MDKNFLVKLIGFPATLIHGDTLVLDRWIWIKSKLSKFIDGSFQMKLLDVGCGSGAFTIGSSKIGFHSLGLSWDIRNQEIAEERARISNAYNATFEVKDIRFMDDRKDWVNKFDVLICAETIEHIKPHEKLMEDMNSFLKEGGVLLLTTPNIDYKNITKGDDGPFDLDRTDGWHVRKGYSKEDLQSLCAKSGFTVKEIQFCSGFLSQKITFVLRNISAINPILDWIIILPFRIFPIIFDKLIYKLTGWPYFSICLVAMKSNK